MTRVEDLRACAALGVDAVGFNLWPGSKRHLDLREAERLIADAKLDEAGPLRVGVFVDLDPPAIAEAIAVLDLDLIQAHGDAPLEPIIELAARYDIGWIQVIRGTPQLDQLDQLMVPEPRPRWILLDAAVPGFGGAGQRTDWAWAAAAVEALAPTPVWLAGGITPSNVAAALREVEPAGIDVASGAELPGARRGEKQREAIEALVRACHG
ncbi:MAG: phosphoribosylanthranilate isomerase [Enhygromyxa sp.]